MLVDGHGILRSDIDEDLIKRATNVAAVALDTQFRNQGYVYGEFLSVLLDNGIISPTKKVMGRVGAFVVSRKDAQQRLICDPRLANEHIFRPPPPTQLPSAANLHCRFVSCLRRLTSVFGTLKPQSISPLVHIHARPTTANI